MSRVGENIKQAREKSGMTVKALAKKLGVAEKFLNEVEIGRKVASEGLIDKAAKVLKADLNDISMVVTDEILMEEKKTFKEIPKKNENSELWTDAFSSVLRSVPIYNYSLSNKKGTKEMPVHSNKIDGYPQDKVFYLEIEDDEMNGFRMLKGDIAFAHSIKEVSNNGFFLIDYKGQRKIRQVKVLGNSKVLLVSNAGNLLTETMELKEIEVIAKLEKVEITL
ncbi:transcriptional regulator with XRE-family HTH domain [Clostridium saccharoperbutylacetonicum]|uniref:Putative transcription factor, MBF1 like protein n=1 Tax=Clostridium saccharoperbutylacetonicum N1-4(HMT) TaxID=931276 RepID=M1MBR3_9CLOT|nr:helix-turn-helix transcriptional regulator [Clostridium saccharoperbutylacetonicum]AGF53883.1 putative transcription factor, MBF1 like protein [Clostridium saccharoperbutylacetonicum N1-4(HMT)]NRT59604.1 transcriptional regulator with XRE-family HTH domain [Clostridium saccharoperbutylacetonicum]NSB28796.1 transcriptional regulator with XRE-family HTH domain [Clostridium saccharoperbutylacetonicum]NSB42287.1 transcriptional regulator with XRE-family HTH domain [Clostridium saccharoperbutylac